MTVFMRRRDLGFVHLKTWNGRLEILRLPHPLLWERVDVVDRNACRAEYCVANPSLLTFQVHSHRGRVLFEPPTAREDAVIMRWDVDLRPLDGWGMFVRYFTQLVLRSLTTNLQAEFDATMPGSLLEEGWVEQPWAGAGGQ